MFFAFCGHFLDKIYTEESDPDSECSEDDMMTTQKTTVDQVKERLTDFIANCLNVKKLKLE